MPADAPVPAHSQTRPAAGFARVLAAESVSNFGTMLSRLAIPWLAALTLNASAAQMAALLVADVVAGAFGALWLGSLVDRRGKRAVMLLADGTRALLLAALALLAWQGTLTMTMLVLAASLSGLMSMAFELARSAWMAQCVDEAGLPGANARLSVAGSVSEAAAFALGGWLYQGAGAVVALALDALSYLGSALCLRGVPDAPRARSAPPDMTAEGAALTSAWRALRREIADGLAAIAGHTRLRALAGVQALLALAMALTGTSYMIHVSRDVALPTGPLGMIAALGALGAIAGAGLAPRLGRRIGPGWTMSIGLVAFAAGAACIPLAQTAGWVAMALLAAHQVVGDAGHTLHDVHDRTLRQTAAPAALLARVDAGIRFGGQVATLAGALLGGWLGTLASARAVLWLAAALSLCAALLAAATLTRPAPVPPPPAQPGKRE